MGNEKFNQPWERSSTTYKFGKPIGYTFGYGCNKHNDGPKGKIAYVETDDPKVADFIQAAPDMCRVLSDISNLLGQGYPHENLVAELEAVHSEIDKSLAKARGEV